jgi:signal transduction histidine kinase
MPHSIIPPLSGTAIHTCWKGSMRTGPVREHDASPVIRISVRARIRFGYAVQIMTEYGISTGTSMSITITPPYWMTWWFRSIVLLGFLSIGPIVYIRRVQQLKTEKERQEDFSRQLIDSQEDERKRIASELHDSIGQNLLYIKNSAVLGKNKNDLNRFSDISETASSSIDEIRRITYDLFPVPVGPDGIDESHRIGRSKERVNLPGSTAGV